MLNPSTITTREPRYHYPNHETFIKIHDHWIKTEMDREIERVEDFNEAGKSAKAYLLHLPDPSDPFSTYAIRINFNRSLMELAPHVGDFCRLQILDGCDSKESTWARAQRIHSDSSPISDASENFIDFEVPGDTPGWDKAEWRDVMGPEITNTSTEQPGASSVKSSHFQIRLQLRPSTATFEAERATLKAAQEIWANDSPRAAVLDTLVLCKAPRRVVDLARSVYGHLPLDHTWSKLNPKHHTAKTYRILEKFNADQMSAFRLMRNLPDGLAFVPGCPGSGKTAWALQAVALAQIGRSRVQTLYLLDINNTVDDAAVRMAKLYEQWGLPRKVIRMSGWGKAIQTSKDFAQNALLKTTTKRPPSDPSIEASKTGDQDEKDQKKPSILADDPEEEAMADFRNNFAREAVKAQIKGRAPPKDGVYTLDEAAWEEYSAHADRYPGITDNLGQFLKAWDESNGKDAELDPRITKPLWKLYRQVLRKTDFIATTPFAAQTYLRFLRPDIILFDEAGHAREVSTLMSVVYFRPKFWVFVGDHRQIRPYVSRPSRERGETEQPLLFCISAMERLAQHSLVHKGLLVNHRARGGLHRLPSEVFYNGQMTSGISGAMSSTTLKLREYLNKQRGRPSAVPRLVVSISDARPSRSGTSWYNPDHQKWVMDRIGAFLNDESLLSTNGQDLASILIICPYKASVEEYETAIGRQFPVIGRSRVMVRTTNTCQGIEADIVIADLAHCSAFVNEPRRLCVTLTRARQAEIILLRHRWSKEFSYLRSIWEAAEAGGQTLHTEKGRRQEGTMSQEISEW